ncbi:hypothetical protein EDD18DRAFT_1392898 [Armillaria luteobubalina]|uniref:Uncharacterized protein n=1 Tax=Armillaria luteobubalina TaxID=153913 RepID=A0AA39Q5M2_9AGAR|nr:hypothetical protein EDD18DRAFT_1392898 [Armillaria luteobubalina]
MARSVLLTVCVTYLPSRAAAFAPGSENSKNFLKRLRTGLDSLCLPHPKTTERDSPFHELLKDRVSNVQQEQLSNASISNIFLKEPNKKKIKPNHRTVSHPVPSLLTPHVATFAEKILDAPSHSFLPDLTESAWMNVSYPQYTESEHPGPTEPECPVSIGTEYPAPTSSEIPSPYSNPPNQSGPLSLHQSAPLEEVLPSNLQVLIGKQASHSASPPPPPAKRPRSRSPSDDDECSLLHELGSLNEEIKTLAARQTVIQEKLKAIGAQTIPEPNFLFRDQFEIEIETERKRRIECEMVLTDIRRECRVPFIVPALFDAFVDISKLTTAAIDSLP